MRKKLALLLAAIMVIGMVPMTAFATTTNRITNVVSGDTDTDLNTSSAPDLKMYEKDLTNGTSTTTAFELDLANAEWLDAVFNKVDTDGTIKAGDSKVAEDVKFVQGMSNVVVTKLSAKSIIISGDVNKAADAAGVVDGKNGVIVKMLTSLTDEGEATVTIDPMESVISSGTYKFATVSTGSATVTVEKKADISQDGDSLKNIVIKETSAGAIKTGTLKLKLTSDWKFKGTPTLTVYPKDSLTVTKTTPDEEDCTFDIDVHGTSAAKTITIASAVEYDEDEVDPGDICQMTVSGCEIDKTTLDVATAVTYGVTFTAEDKTVPTLYSGQADPDKDTLKVTMKEAVADSWLTNRKTTITFPVGVKVLGVDMTCKENCNLPKYTIDNDEDHGEVKIEATKTGKAKIEFKFQLSISPSFTGDVTATLGGAGVDKEVEATVATVVAPVKVEAAATDAVIDYRHTAVGDITVTEAEAGVLKKGTKLALKIEDLGFDNDPKVEVTSGDLVIDNVSTSGGIVTIKIKSESAKTPAVIKLTGCELYMERNVPAGTYALKLTADKNTFATDDAKAIVNANGTDYKIDGWDEGSAIFQNSVTDGQKYKDTPLFDSRNVTVVKNYVNVVTAGRDTSSFTTQIKVTIGANQMTAGSNTINLDVPAYISGGYTMLPVRAVTESLSSAAIVRWDDATKTVTITFGTRVISMKVGSKTMTINGVEVAMQAQCEITDARAFIPLRDLGYALGLGDNKIQWDDATKTATLN